MWKECPLCLSNVLHNCLVKPFLSFLNFFCCCCLYFFIICFYPVCVCDPFYIWFVHTYVQCTIWDIVRIFAYFSYENYIVICALTEQVREKLVILNNYWYEPMALPTAIWTITIAMFSTEWIYRRLKKKPNWIKNENK